MAAKAIGICLLQKLGKTFIVNNMNKESVPRRCMSMYNGGSSWGVGNVKLPFIVMRKPA
jgi:hypothetical protein